MGTSRGGSEWEGEMSAKDVHDFLKRKFPFTYVFVYMCPQVSLSLSLSAFITEDNLTLSFYCVNPEAQT